jgi:hypothetical protein
MCQTFTSEGIDNRLGLVLPYQWVLRPSIVAAVYPKVGVVRMVCRHVPVSLGDALGVLQERGDGQSITCAILASPREAKSVEVICRQVFSGLIIGKPNGLILRE